MKGKIKYQHLWNKPYFKELYNTYKGMVFRVKNDTSYTQKNIKICDEWCGDKGFENFYDWSIANGYKKELIKRGNRTINKYSLDRIDCVGNYEPNNCRWTTWDIQDTNRSKHYIHSKLYLEYKAKL